MKVLLAHVVHRLTGGEEAVVDAERRLLTEHNVEVHTLCPTSDSLKSLRPIAAAGLFFDFANHKYGRRTTIDAMRTCDCDVVHFHNLYPLLGPGAVQAAHDSGTPCFVTLHNYRLSCLAGTHLYGGTVCERCTPGSYASGIARRCYRGSWIQSYLMSRALTRQWALLVCGVAARIFMLSSFMMSKYVGYGLPAAHCLVKPNSVDYSVLDSAYAQRAGVVYLGRLSAEKGVELLVRHWPIDGPELTIVGDGPLMKAIAGSAGPNVRQMGAVDPSKVRGLLATARVLVIPSVSYEGLPMAVLEAYAEGTPVVGFAHGGVEAVVSLQGGGFAVPPGDWSELIQVATRVAAVDEPGWNAMSQKSRSIQRSVYSHELNAIALLRAYEEALL